MAYQFVTVPLADLGQGIDQLSAENAIREGFSEYLLNVDPLPEGYLAKRVGYQSFAGQIPFRVERVEHLSATGDNNLCFYLDSAIDLSSVRSHPIIVKGRLPEVTTGDFTATDVTRYYPSFTADVRKIIISDGTPRSLVIDQNEHEISSNNIWTGITQSTSTTDNSNSLVTPDDIEVDTTNQEITIQYTSADPSFDRAFVYTLDSTPEAGRLYQATGTVNTAPTPTVINIPAATHNLSNFNIIPKLFLEESSILREITPDSFEVEANGTVNCEFTYTGVGTPNYRLDLLAAPAANTKEGTVAHGGTPITVTLSGLTSDFLFTGIYLIDTITPGNPKQLVFPDSIVIDALNKTADVTFVNSMTVDDVNADATFQIVWEEVRVVTNKLCVTSHTSLQGSFPFSYEKAQLTLWGLLHSEAYGSNLSGDRNGWVTHLDSYRSSGIQRLVAGLGGNLFAAYENTETDSDAFISSSTSEDELPNHYPNLRTRVDTETVIAPAFYDTTGATPERSRGYYRVTGATDGFIKATATEYLGANLVRYTVATPGRVTPPGTPIATSDNDYLTVQQAGYSINNGEFLITAIDDSSPTELLITVFNPNIDSSDYDESDSGMDVGVFTDRFSTSDNCPFIPGDQLVADLFEEGSDYKVIAGSGTTCYLRNVTDEFHLDQGLRVVAKRTSSIIPIRNLVDSPTVNNLVRGDVLSYSPIERQLKIRSINAQADITVDITVAAGVATATLFSGNTDSFILSQKLLLVRAGAFSGEVTISSIPDSQSFEFLTEETTGFAGATLLGKTIEIDEDLEWQDSTGSTILLSVPRRWFPIEAPDDSFDLTPNYYYRHFDKQDYDEQDFLRSVMVSDNLYLTNGSDRVHKFDGTNVYRAGLPRWQPHLFTSLTTGGGISYTAITAATTGMNWTDSYFHVSPIDAGKFTVGQEISSSNSQHVGYTFIITGISDTAGHIYVNQKIPGTVGATTLSSRVLYRYYFRLNAVDKNNNIIASATVGSEDFRVELSQSSTIQLKLVGLPPFDNYDYDTIDVEIYRTKANGVAPYYRIATLGLSFDDNVPYITYNDTTSDDTLRDLDATTSALMGAELGTRWSGPLKAKYTTTAGNRLVLGNLSSDQTLDIRLLKNTQGDDITGTVLNGNKWVFKKDSNDPDSTTNNSTRMAYVFTTTAGTTINPAADIAYGPPDTVRINNVTLSNTASVGDWIYLYHSTALKDISLAGWYQVSAVSAGTYIEFESKAHGSPTEANQFDRVLLNTDGDVPVFLGTDYNYNQLGGNPDTVLFPSIESTATRRLANAINASMRVIGTSPWLLAGGGDDFNNGQLVVTQPIDSSTKLEVEVPNYSGYVIFVNNRRVDPGDSAGALEAQYPSRIIASYPNYPELFENPTAIVDSDSESAIDINSADGQQITGIIPFFGDTAFGSSLRGGVIVVFKTNSIYLVDLAQKAVGANPVQKLESRGLGCTAPYSIAPSKEGIIFANESGIYKLTRQLTVEYVGRFVERIWKKEIDRNYLPIFHGHYYAINNQYKLSTVIQDDQAPSEVLVYNTVREYNSQAGLGSWTKYDNHPAIGWANLNQDAFFASTAGEVFSLRRTGLKQDYRDDSSPINMEATLRATNFGDPARRKLVSSVTIDFRVDGVDDQGIQVLSTTDFSDQYDQLDNFIVKTGADNLDGLSDEPEYRIRSIQFAIKQRRSIYLQTKITDNTKDQSVEIASVSYRVSGLEDSGILEAKDSSTKR